MKFFQMLKKDVNFQTKKTSKLMKFLGSDMFFNGVLGVFFMTIIFFGTFLMYSYGKDNWWKEDHPNSSKVSSEIIVKLRDDLSPETVRGFLNKVDEKYFDGKELSFLADAVQTSEFSQITNDILTLELKDMSLKRGDIALVNSSTGIPFEGSILMQKTDQPMNQKFVKFGDVIGGIDLVDSIQTGDKIKNIEKLSDGGVKIFIEKAVAVSTSEQK